MAVEWQGFIRKVIDLGSESYEQRMAKLIFIAAMAILGLILVWRILK